MNVSQELLEIKLLITQSSAFFGFDTEDNFVAPCLQSGVFVQVKSLFDSFSIL